MEDLKTMGVVQIAKMVEWLEMHGHSAEEAIQCIKYIAGRETDDGEKKEDIEKGLVVQPNKLHD